MPHESAARAEGDSGPGHAGGRITGRFDDAAQFEAIATAADALAAPRDGLDRRLHAEHQAEALSDICAFALEHGSTPHHDPGDNPASSTSHNATDR